MRSFVVALLRPVALLPALAAACAHPNAPPSPPAAAAASPSPPVASAPPAARDEAPPARARFENPGGMWMPEQLVSQAETLRALGLAVDPAALTDPSSDLLQSIVSLGGCSASFVSEDGLIATNHHCAVGALQYNSTPKENLLHDGFVARTRAEERSNGPSARVYVTQAIEDVTREMQDGLDRAASDVERTRLVERHEEQLVAACERGRPGVRCSVASYFGGAQYRRIEQLEIEDVRLVFAPHLAVGNFGGEIDNWRWPRHTGDVSLFRAYVGKDGKPATFARDNVPYKSPHHLRLASKPLAPGDLVMIAGYPGHTNRLRTAAEADEAVRWFYPREIAYREQAVAALEQLSATSPELKLKASPSLRGLANYLTKYRGVLEGLGAGGLAREKARDEEELRRWVAADPARAAKYGDVLDGIAAEVTKSVATRDADARLGEVYAASMLGAASRIVHMAEERPKPDSERRPAYQAREWPRLEQAQRQLQKRYDPAIDRAFLRLALRRAAQLPAAQRPPFVAVVLGAGEPTDATIDAAVDALYAKTKLGDEETRVRLLTKATLADLKRSKDPIVQLALELRPIEKAKEDREDARDGAMLRLVPRYVEMLQAWRGRAIAPDANGTLRITYGTVRGYRPNPQAAEYAPFTTMKEVLRKSSGKEPFDTPDTVLAAARAKRFGADADATLGDLPVDFLSDLDITNGNSGSATLNARGELVGLAFDGNYESMASDWVFQPAITRTIHVDARYVLWLLDGPYGADHLVKEMGGTPTVQ